MALGQTTTTTPFGSTGRRTTDTTTSIPTITVTGPCRMVDMGIGTPEDNYHCDLEKAGGYLPCQGRQMPASVWAPYFSTNPPPAVYPNTPDCNGNGISDPCDIEYGISQDTNSNGIPDECDF